MTLREKRHQLGLTQQEVAQQLGTTQIQISRWERGENSPRKFQDAVDRFMNQSPASFGQTLRNLRYELGFSQQEIADALGVSNRTISFWELGKSYPQRHLWKHIRSLLGITVQPQSKLQKMPGMSQALQKLPVTLREIANKVGVSHQAVAYWRNGRGAPAPHHYAKLIEAFPQLELN